jgi:hypothetical protein
MTVRQPGTCIWINDILLSFDGGAFSQTLSPRPEMRVMTNRLMELAIEALEAKKATIEVEIDSLRGQLNGGTAAKPDLPLLLQSSGEGRERRKRKKRRAGR